MNKKIDLFYLGDYVCSTNQSKTCKEAVKKYLDNLSNSKHSFTGLTLVQTAIDKNPKGLKAFFDRSK